MEKLDKNIRQKHKRLTTEEYPNTVFIEKLFENWNNIDEFIDSQIKPHKCMSRQPVYDFLGYQAPTSDAFFIIICHKLGFTNSEIRKFLKESKPNSCLAACLKDPGENPYDKDEQAMISIYRRLKKKDMLSKSLIFSHLQSMCAMADISCEKELDVLRPDTEFESLSK